MYPAVTFQKETLGKTNRRQPKWPGHWVWNYVIRGEAEGKNEYKVDWKIINIDSKTWKVREGAHLEERRLKSSLGCMKFEGTTSRWRYLSYKVLEMGNLLVGAT